MNPRVRRFLKAPGFPVVLAVVLAAAILVALPEAHHDSRDLGEGLLSLVLTAIVLGFLLLADREPSLGAALRKIRRAADRDGSEAIYLHAHPEDRSYGLLLRGETKLRAERLLGEDGRDAYDHSHLDGEE